MRSVLVSLLVRASPPDGWRWGVSIRRSSILPSNVAAQLSPAGARALLDQYCISSHNDRRYLSASDKISALAIGDPARLRSISRIGRRPTRHPQPVDGLPIGTRGGMLVRHTFLVTTSSDASCGALVLASMRDVHDTARHSHPAAESGGPRCCGRCDCSKDLKPADPKGDSK